MTNCNVAITFDQSNSNQFILERHFFASGLKERALFFKLPLVEEDRVEEWSGGKCQPEVEEEQLNMRMIKEMAVLVQGVKEEWLGWQELPFFPPLVQFKPGYYLVTSSEVNWPQVSSIDPAEINLDGPAYDYDFLTSPKVQIAVVISSQNVKIRSQVVRLTLGPGYVALKELPCTVWSSGFGSGNQPSKKICDLAAQILPKILNYFFYRNSLQIKALICST